MCILVKEVSIMPESNTIKILNGLLLILAVLIFFKRAETKFIKRAPLVKVIAKINGPIVTKVIDATHKEECSTKNLEVDLLENDNVNIVFQVVATGDKFDIENLVRRLEGIEGVTHVELSHNYRK